MPPLVNSGINGKTHQTYMVLKVCGLIIVAKPSGLDIIVAEPAMEAVTTSDTGQDWPPSPTGSCWPGWGTGSVGGAASKHDREEALHSFRKDRRR